MSDSPKHESLSGVNLGGFRFEERIGQGPACDVYRGFQVALRRTVALKRLRDEAMVDPEAVDRFLWAGRTFAAVIHPNILPIYDIANIDGVAFIVEEHMPGGSLAEWTREGHPLPAGTVLTLARQCLDALEVVRSEGFVHGNLSAANILKTSSGAIVLSDFGHPPRRPGVMGVRQSSAVIYMAPEVLTGEAPTSASDIFSLGVLLYLAGTGRHPWTLEEYLFQARASSLVVPDPQAANPGFSPSMGSILTSMLHHNPADRPASYADVLAAINELQASRKSASLDLRKYVTEKARILGMPTKRKYRRLPSNLDVRIQPRMESLEMADKVFSKIRNVSENGVFVTTAFTMNVGSIVNLDFELEDKGVQVKAVGVVRWVSAEIESPGMGVQFVEVSTTDKATLQTFVDDRMLSEMCKTLTSSQTHRLILRMYLKDPGGTIPLAQVLQSTGASQQLALRALNDFVKFKLIAVGNDTIRFLPPASALIPKSLEDTLRMG